MTKEIGKKIINILDRTLQKIRLAIECTEIYNYEGLDNEDLAEINRRITLIKKIYDEVCKELEFPRRDILNERNR